ncbi:MAG: putative DNA binding domain-containing protein [Ignavibacteriales bacterium]|nr:putative DNA binding domain-containing protein [Ignavibacteriales bacterium]
MTQAELLQKLADLLSLPGETETVEYKSATNDFHFDNIGKYFSALSNEANLRGNNAAWLLFGVRDDKTICGSHYRRTRPELDSLKLEIANHTTANITFIEIHEVLHIAGRVLLFEIPPAPSGIPVAWKGHCYGRAASSLVALSIDKLETIRAQQKITDWSANIVPAATIADLDPVAISHAKVKFKSAKSVGFLHGEIDSWDDTTFLDKTRITISGSITNAAILLLGKPQSVSLLLPSIGQISWVLKSSESGYQHFGPPFLLTVNDVYTKIRNLNFKHLLPNSIDPVEIAKYDQWSILEALNNCIAHQDYTLCQRIVVTETDTELCFTNAGYFIEGFSPEEYYLVNRTPRRYRNPFLSQAMHTLGMIDTIGSGIKRIIDEHMKRFLPLPGYDFSEPETTSLRFFGRIIDTKYTDLLIIRKDLDLKTIVALDRVQKRLPITPVQIKALKKAKLIEGRAPNFHVSPSTATATGDQVEYIHKKGLDDNFYKELILQYLITNGQASRKEIDSLLLSKLPGILSDEQKQNKVRNLLMQLSTRSEKIKNIGTRKSPLWQIA